MKLFKRVELSHRSILLCAGTALLIAQGIDTPAGSAQVNARYPDGAHEIRVSAGESDIEARDSIERAVTSICEERVRDPKGSIPIDQMAVQPPRPLSDPLVIAGKKRAERLLPAAKRLVPSVLGRLAAHYNLEALSHNWILARVKAVNTIKPEIEAHDNAYWRPNEPNVIILGTVFLAGIRSDEAMITVLAHELTHAVNGTDQALRPLFARVETRASQIGNLSIQGEQAVELTCETVGLQTMHAHTGKAAGKGTTRRLARAVGKNCVQRDIADDSHLSPRQTLRVLLALEPGVTKVIAMAREKRHPRKVRD
jgi:hypothetical protein